MPVEETDFLSKLAREVLKGNILYDLKSLFADETKLSRPERNQTTLEEHTEPLLVPLRSAPTKNWRDWMTEKLPAVRRSKVKHPAAGGHCYSGNRLDEKTLR